VLAAAREPWLVIDPKPYVGDGDNPYINGYSSGVKRAWLEGELVRAQQSDDIDWIVVCVHQVAMSSAHFNGADLGIRQRPAYTGAAEQ